MAEGSKTSWSWRFFWPKVDDIESAKAATLQGVITAAFISVVTAVIATISLVAQEPVLGIDAWAYIDAILMAIVAWRVKRFSRAFALGGTALFIIEKTVQFLSQDAFRMAFILSIFLINGTRGVFVYNRFKPSLDFHDTLLT